MLINKAKSVDTVGADVKKGSGTSNRLKGGGVFTVRCHDKEGNLKWEQRSHNLVVNVGLAASAVHAERRIHGNTMKQA